MSEVRLRVLNFLRSFIDQNGYAPSVRDIAEGCGISNPSIIQHHLNMLEKEGHIRRSRRTSRSLQLVEKDSSEIPILGVIAAGTPIPVPHSDTWANACEETIKLPPEIVQSSNGLYALRVKGTSMIDALIDDGDIVIMEHQQTANDGDMVAVWLKDREEVTLKKIYLEQDQVRLQPANEKMEPIYIDPQEMEIQGKVVAVFRRLNL